MPYDASELWRFLPVGYALTVLLETPVLWFGLSPGHRPARRLVAAAWLTACTYPIVVLVLPPTMEAAWGRTAYVAVAETFAPVAECLLFWLAFGASSTQPRGGDESPATTNLARDLAAVVAANLTSFLVGGWLVSLAGL